MGPSPEPTRARRYLPLPYRVAILNAALLVAAVVVTLVVLAPRRLSSVAVDEASILAASLILVGVVNLVLLHRLMGPITGLTALARRVDLNRPGIRMPEAGAGSEAGELAGTFNQMLDRLEAERREATGRVLAGQEAERLRIAQELHDQIGQDLTAVLLSLARVQASVAPDQRELVDEVQEAVRGSLEDVRRIALELRPEALDELGLISALAVLGDRLSERAGLTIRQEIGAGLSAAGLGPEVELVLYRVAQEALTNVARHSGTDRATLSLLREGNSVVLKIVDDGRGLAPDALAGTGIRGMQERAALVGGVLSLTPRVADRGCRVTLTVGLPAPAAVRKETRDPAGHAHPAG